MIVAGVAGGGEGNGLRRTWTRPARQAVKAWSEPWNTSVALGQLNREALRARVRRKPRGAAGR